MSSNKQINEYENAQCSRNTQHPALLEEPTRKWILGCNKVILKQRKPNSVQKKNKTCTPTRKLTSPEGGQGICVNRNTKPGNNDSRKRGPRVLEETKEMVISSLPIILIHAVLIRTLRCHRGGRRVRGSFRVIDKADKCLGVQSERLAHQTGDSI